MFILMGALHRRQRGVGGPFLANLRMCRFYRSKSHLERENLQLYRHFGLLLPEHAIGSVRRCIFAGILTQSKNNKKKDVRTQEFQK
ncbi:hypothetical protein VN24_06130 [Paenibacillus beijingensis]|uniref:Uncharacterized protein n=1 Tax=Paenibacillus beijingensis TaxID=1126833 RepID=A0A0D5NG52_9BACL|nr:hypothetical protein VN24_06130 [Paenibacillus beijingensis]